MDHPPKAETTAAQLGASHLIDSLMHQYSAIEIELSLKDQEKITMNDITSLITAGETWKRAAYEEFDTPDIRKSWKPETHSKVAETRFDQWSEWRDALKALEGKAPISKTIGLLVKEKQKAEENIAMISKDFPASQLGLSNFKPEQLNDLVSLHQQRALFYQKAIRMVEADWKLKQYSDNGSNQEPNNN